MTRSRVLMLLWLALGVAHAQEDGLRPGQFAWTPDLAPNGPVAIIVSLPAQRAYVYRNGVRIGVSTVSSGKPGFETPSGIYSVLQKHREHYSNRYDNAPMPYMQRLTWSGVALHAGALPGYPASHGCVRLPEAFARKLFATTGLGTVVVVADGASFPPAVVSPGLSWPLQPDPDQAPEAGGPGSFQWSPERAPQGPVSVLMSTADRRIVVLRNAIEIGRAAFAFTGKAVGTRAWLLLDGARDTRGTVPADRRGLRWLELPMQAGDAAAAPPIDPSQLVVPPAFAGAVQDALRPGATVILTDQPLQPAAGDQPVLESEAAARDP